MDDITAVTPMGNPCAPGTVLLDKYEVEAHVGSGAMGHILRALRLDGGDPVAIKLMRDDLPMDQDNIRRFYREAKSASRLRSEHVAKIHDIGALDSGVPFIVMELLDGTDLWNLIVQQGRVAVRFAADLILQTCDALAEAHAIGIVHRDIKPANLFLAKRRDGSMHIKVLDFGVSKTGESVDASITKVHALIGTPHYMSPEQAQSGMVDARSDIWALGAVLFELVEGFPPFQSDNFAELCTFIAFEPPRAMVNAAELAPVIMRCLEKEPDRRYQNVADLAADLARFAPAQSAQTYVPRINRVLGRPTPPSFDQVTPPPSSPRLAPRPAAVPKTMPAPPVAVAAPISGRTAWIIVAVVIAIVVVIALLVQ